MTATVERVELSREIPGVGRLDFIETEKQRAYWLLPEGAQRRVRLPSVTGVIRDTWPKPALLEWYAREGVNAAVVLKEAQARGTDCHRFVETFMQTGELLPFSDFREDRKPYLQGLVRFLWEHEPRAVDVERLICHPELRYAGRLDLLAVLKDSSELTLLDFKSNPKGNVYAEAHVQCAGYSLADHRCGGERIERALVVGVSEQGKYKIVPTPLNEAVAVWKDALVYYGTMKALLKALGEA
jgi:hypothetical protein